MDEDADDSLDDFLDEGEQELVKALSARDVEAIDAAILAAARDKWLKVAFIVGPLWTKLNPRDDHRIPLGFLVRRVASLVEVGRLQSQGDVRQIRFSEVRLPGRADQRGRLS
jgi:hypothetical protein